MCGPVGFLQRATQPMVPAGGKSVPVLSRSYLVQQTPSLPMKASRFPTQKASVSVAKTVRTFRPAVKSHLDTTKRTKPCKRVLNSSLKSAPKTKPARRSVQARVLPSVVDEGPSPGNLARCQKLTKLERKSISTESQGQYDFYLDKFKVFCRESGGAWPVPDIEVDLFLADYMDKLFEEGRPAHEGEKTLAAVDFHSLSLKGKMVRSRRALKGWRKIRPSTSRLPLPKLVLMGIAMDMVARNLKCMALMALMAFHLYLRPGEAIELKKKHVVAPVRMAGNQFAWINVIIRDQESGRADKVGVFDNSLPFDQKD